MMRLVHHTSPLPVPPPTPFWLALIATMFAACQLARSAGAAPSAPRSPTAPYGDATASDPNAGDDAFSGSALDGDRSDAIDGDALEGDPTVVRTRAPAIAAVLRAAYRAAGLDRTPSKSWIRRARLAGLIPWLTVRTGRDTSWQTDDPSVDHGFALDIRATWRLDRLAFDGRELQVASIEAARRRERRRLASRVIRTYFTWQRAVTRTDRTPSTRSRALEAAAELDALTDGWFSETLVRLRRTASETRTP